MFGIEIDVSASRAPDEAAMVAAAINSAVEKIREATGDAE
jgi:hypothetical protein